ncbi:PREDICTED: mitochondrial import receptor subunit TOM70-like isoform X2 [Wasmannia auropunctata]|nr:PREDICTED: mitochondrial import receptor subunit TOM70-like isoform X2 [Wasmannia auropunctata]
MNDLAIFYQNRAAANEKLKKYSDVKADCTKALELNPKYMKAFLRRARALEQLEDLEAALDDLNTVRIYEHFSNKTTNAMADEILEKLVKQYVQENLANIKFTMPSKEFVRMYILSFPKDPVFSRLQHPENIPEFLKKPLQALKDKKYDDIIPLCTEVIQRPEFDTLPSSRLEVLLLRATFYTLSSSVDSAIQDFEQILSSKDASNDVKTNILIKRGNLHAKLDNFGMAFKDFELAINMNPNYSEIYYHRGLVYKFMGRLDETKHDLEKTIECNPNFFMGYMQKCYFEYYIVKGVYDFVTAELTNIQLIKLLRNFKKSFVKFQNSSEYSYCNLLYAEIMMENQQYKTADNFLATAMENDPENAVFCVIRAIFQLHWKNDFDKTVELLNKALDLDEKCEMAYEALGCIAARRGNLEEAVKFFDKALILCRTSTELTDIYNLREDAKLQLKIKNSPDSNILQSSTRFEVEFSSCAYKVRLKRH